LLQECALVRGLRGVSAAHDELDTDARLLRELPDFVIATTPRRRISPSAVRERDRHRTRGLAAGFAALGCQEDEKKDAPG
jgi:hypothetical protein